MKITILICFVGILMCGACDGREHVTVIDTVKTSETKTSKPLGITSECVLCVGHEIEVMSDTPFSDYQDKRYYFCSNHCKKAFDKDPAGSIAKNAASKKEATSQPSTQPGGAM